MYSYNQLFDMCFDIVQKRKDLIYKKPLKLSLYTITILFQKAKERGINYQDWLPGTTLYNSLTFALSSSEELSKMPCSVQKIKDLSCLAFILNMNDDWKSGVKCFPGFHPQEFKEPKG